MVPLYVSGLGSAHFSRGTVMTRTLFDAPRRLRRRFIPKFDELEDRIVPDSTWSGFARDPQHTALSSIAAQSMDIIHWNLSIDENFTGFAHYGSPVVTAANNV